MTRLNRCWRRRVRAWTAPVTFLYPQVWTTVAHRRVKGLSEPYRTDPLWHLDEVWIEE